MGQDGMVPFFIGFGFKSSGMDSSHKGNILLIFGMTPSAQIEWTGSSPFRVVSLRLRSVFVFIRCEAS